MNQEISDIESTASMKLRANVLGDVRAEVDSRMLDTAFYESPDYRTLIESSDRCIVVGRRGTGKSALAYKLGRHFEKALKTLVLRISPDEDEIMGLRPIAELFGSQFRAIRAGSTIAWRYALFMEVAELILHSRSRMKKDPAFAVLEGYAKIWRVSDSTLLYRLKTALRRVITPGARPEAIVGELARDLGMRELENAVREALLATELNVVILLDRLDEGYEPDEVGVGIIDGLAQASIDVETKLPSVRCVLFLRDNIYRTIAKLDPDFSRTIEAQTIRLHWDEYALLNLTANRLRKAFDIDLEQSLKVWDRCAASGLGGREGFRKCLRLTLYRPRDLLILLNEAFLSGARQERDRIVSSDVEISAKSISSHRIEDLRKEYTAIFPSVTVLMDGFANTEPEMSVQQALTIVETVMRRTDLDALVQQYFAISRTSQACLRDLYSVGFVGQRDPATGNFVFCHDGRDPTREFESEQKLLVHPCYWMALNIANRDMDPTAAQEIYDEYEIKISSETPARRAQEIGSLIAELGKIPVGHDGWVDFEDWVFRAIQIVFAGRLRNIEMRPNGDALQRRDIVATNLSESPFWRRIYEDYQSRQVIFEVKNYAELTEDDFRQALSYASGEYGRCVFFITRASDMNLRRGKELDWVRELYSRHKLLTIKLGDRLLSSLLGKLRNPPKHDAAEKSMNAVVDQYLRMYLDGGRSKSS